MSDFASLRHLLDARADSSHPETVDLIHLDSRLGERDSCTYSELRNRALRIGAFLSAINSTEQRVIIALDAGIDYLAAVLGARYANWTAIPSGSPNTRANRRRLDSIVNVSNADAVVCTKGNSHRVQTLSTRTNLKLCIVDELTDARPEDTFDTSVDTPAIVQFTSGSTRAPKGVVLKDSQVLQPSCHARGG